MIKAEVMELLLEGYKAFHKEDQGYKDVKEMAEYMQEKGLGGFPYEYIYKEVFESLHLIAEDLEKEGYLEREVVNLHPTFRYRKELKNEPKSANRELRMMEIAAVKALRKFFKDNKGAFDPQSHNAQNWSRFSFFVTLIKNLQEIRKNLG